MNRQHTPSVLAGAAVTAALLLPLAGHAAGPGQEPDPPSDPDTRPCFMEPLRWNEALDGPLPRCPAFTSAPMAPDTDPDTGEDHTQPWLLIL